MGVYAVTGANRGLGLEFCKQLLAAGHTVYGLCRNPEKATELNALQGDLTVLAADVSSEDSLKSAASKLGAVDVLINNSGVFGERGQGLSSLSIEAIQGVMDVNVYGVIRAVRSFLPALKQGQEKKIVNISSLMGSIDDNSSGGCYGYRISKAGVNMLTKTIGHELSGDGFTVIALHPGWVQTDMGGAGAPLTPEDSISAMLKTVASKGVGDSGGFFDRHGEAVSY